MTGFSTNGQDWVVLVALEVGATCTATVDSSVVSVSIGLVIVEFSVIFGMFIGIVGGIVSSGNLVGFEVLQHSVYDVFDLDDVS